MTKIIVIKIYLFFHHTLNSHGPHPLTIEGLRPKNY